MPASTPSAGRARKGRAVRPALLAASCATAALAVPGLAAAQAPAWNAMPVTGLYVGAGVGANWVGKTSANISGTAASALRVENYSLNNGDISFNTGIATVGSLGWGFGNGLRAEAEFGYRNNGVDHVTAGGRVGATGVLNGAGGTQQTYALMFNALYDFQIPGTPWAVPYLGAGLGVAWVDWTGNRISGLAGGSTSLVRNNASVNWSNNSTQFAYQAMAGVSFPIDSVPGLAVTTEFRYFGTLDPEFNATTRITSPVTGAVVRTGTGSVQTQNNNYAVMVGLRYNFGRVPPPPPPPPVAAAPAPARTYLVFFDWDRADLTPRAKEIVADAAANAPRVRATRIEVAGHADRSGSPQYNQRLSQRRADNVAAELVARGVSRADIAITAYGESRPLVPTADGVREPQNRRVEIVLR